MSRSAAAGKLGVADSQAWGAGRTLVWMCVAAAAGCIPNGRLLTKALTGGELYDLGDGKPGSSNVARSVGWKAGAAVLVLDAAKAYVPARLARAAGAGDNTVAAVGLSAMVGHIAAVKGRGAASALGAGFAMDPAMMGAGCVPLVGGSLVHRHAEAVTVTALSLPLLSLALHRSPRRALGSIALIVILFGARLRGSSRVERPANLGVWWRRFWVDRDC